MRFAGEVLKTKIPAGRLCQRSFSRTTMEKLFDRIAADALKLPLKDRVKLAQRLVLTLDDQLEQDVEGLWVVEAERRLEELRTGRVKGIGAGAAFRKARQSLKR
jgi:Putative addiction module component